MILREKGFTLIELMITIAIVSILGAIAMSIYTPFRQKAQCERVVVEVYNAMGLLVEDVAEDGTGPAVSAFNNTQTIGAQAITFFQGVQISFGGNGTIGNPWIVNGQRSDFTCPENDGVYTLTESQTEGAW